GAAWAALRIAVFGGEPRGRAALLRDIFGPVPFRPVPLAPTWRTSAVVALAKTIYEERSFDLLPLLGDALYESRCDNHEMLPHRREQGQVHVRGCWLIDLLLDKQ